MREKKCANYKMKLFFPHLVAFNLNCFSNFFFLLSLSILTRISLSLTLLSKVSKEIGLVSNSDENGKIERWRGKFLAVKFGKILIQHFLTYFLILKTIFFYLKKLSVLTVD